MNFLQTYRRHLIFKLAGIAAVILSFSSINKTSHLSLPQTVSSHQSREKMGILVSVLQSKWYLSFMFMNDLSSVRW